MKDLIRIAAQSGLRLHAAHLPDGLLGIYSPTEGRIYYDLQLTPSEQRSVVAHELGHAYYGHDCDSVVNERQADTYAASLLIDPDDYAALERINPDVHFIAEEMQVTPETIEHFRTFCLRKFGHRTYSSGRLII